MSEQIPKVSQFILKVVENQLSEQKPPEARETLERLQASGFSEEDARRLIGNAVAAEIRAVVRLGRPFNEAQYVGFLRRLPELPPQE